MSKNQFLEYKDKKYEGKINIFLNFSEGDKYLDELSGRTKVIKKTGLMITDIIDKQKPLLEKMDNDVNNHIQIIIIR